MNISPITGRRLPPMEVEAAVVQYYRNKGLGARLGWHEFMKCWVIEIDLKDDDPRREAARKGLGRAVEVVPLHYPSKGGHMTAMELDEIGASGIVELLQQGDLLTGRGEYPDLLTAVRAQHARNEKNKADMYARAAEAGMEAANRNKRQILEGLGHSLPFVTVNDTLKS